jgi:hypothetical protein
MNRSTRCQVVQTKAATPQEATGHTTGALHAGHSPTCVAVIVVVEDAAVQRHQLLQFLCTKNRGGRGRQAGRAGDCGPAVPPCRSSLCGRLLKLVDLHGIA